MPGQVVSPYTSAYSGAVTPCGGVMPSTYVPGTVMFNNQYPQYQPYAVNGSMPMTQYGQPGTTYAQPMTQYNQPTAMPVAGSVAGGVMAQPIMNGMTYANGMTYTNGMTYQPYQSDVMLTSGMHQPGMMMTAGGFQTYPGQQVITSDWSNGYSEPTFYTTQSSGRRGLFGRRR
jgi:hypothetical protein